MILRLLFVTCLAVLIVCCLVIFVAARMAERRRAVLQRRVELRAQALRDAQEALRTDPEAFRISDGLGSTRVLTAEEIANAAGVFEAYQSEAR